MDDDRVDDVGQEGEGEPLEGVGDESVAAEDLKGENAKRHGHNEPHGLDAGERMDGVCDRAQIGADVDGVRSEQQQDRAVQDEPRIVIAQHTREALAADHAQPGADVLNGCHQRIREERGPKALQTEGRARDGVGANAARIVV